MTGTDFASTSLPRHLIRGVIGFAGLVASFALLPAVGPVSLLLLPVGAVALRGCPMCWTIGLLQTLSRGRLQRSCTNGQCHLTAVRPTDQEPGDTPSRRNHRPSTHHSRSHAGRQPGN